MTTSIIVPLFNRHDMTAACVAAVEANTEDFELVLVDNGSTDETRDLEVAVRNPKNRGFAVACNQGARAATGDVLVFLNNDTEVQPGWLPPLLDAMPGVAGPCLTYPHGAVQSSGIIVDFSRPPGREAVNDQCAARPRGRVDAVTGACLVVDRATFAGCGGFYAGYWNGYEDVDLCLTAGGATYVPESAVIHHESQSDHRERFRAVGDNVRLLRARWDEV